MQHPDSSSATDDPTRPAAPTVLVFMGVSGCGKTTVAKCVQQRLGWAFKEGDDLHRRCPDHC